VREELPLAGFRHGFKPPLFASDCNVQTAKSKSYCCYDECHIYLDVGLI
jgi:hypothetical protein